MPTNRNNEVGKAFDIGTKIEYDGKSYKVIESDSCADCSIANICSSSDIFGGIDIGTTLFRDKRINIFGECSSLKRPDSKSVVFVEIHEDIPEINNIIIRPLYVCNNKSQLRPVEFDMPEGFIIDTENSDLDKGIIRFKRKWLSLEQLYKLAKESHYLTNRSAIKERRDGKLVALANLMDITRYFNGDWNYNANGDECCYMIAYDKTRTIDDGYQVVHIISDTDMYFGNIIFKNEADAQYVIDNPNFREVLNNIFKL